MGVSHSMNKGQVDEVLTRFEGTISAIQGIEEKVTHVRGYLDDVRDQRERLTKHAEVATSLVDNLTQSLNQRSEEVMDLFQSTLLSIAEPVERFEFAIINLGIADAPRQMQRELGPLLVPAVVLVAIITCSNGVFGFILAADEKLLSSMPPLLFWVEDTNEQEGQQVSILNLFAVAHVVLIGLAVVYLVGERCRRFIRLRRKRQQRGENPSFFGSFADWLSNNDAPEEAEWQQTTQTSRSSRDRLEVGDENMHDSPSLGRSATASPLVDGARVRKASPPLETATARDAAGGDAAAGSMQDLLDWAVERPHNKEIAEALPKLSGDEGAGPFPEETEDETQLPVVPESPAASSEAVHVGRLVCSRSGRSTWAEDENGTRKAWFLAAGRMAQVVEVDTDGDFRLRTPEGVCSGWVQREAFLPVEGAVVDEASPHGWTQQSVGTTCSVQSAGDHQTLTPGSNSSRGQNYSSSEGSPASRRAARLSPGRGSSREFRTPVAGLLRRLQESSKSFREERPGFLPLSRLQNFAQGVVTQAQGADAQGPGDLGQGQDHGQRHERDQRGNDRGHSQRHDRNRFGDQLVLQSGLGASGQAAERRTPCQAVAGGQSPT